MDANLLVEVCLRAQAVIAGKGIDGEIADEQRGKEIKPERGEDGVAAPVGLTMAGQDAAGSR